MVKYSLCDELGVVVRACGRRMILSAGLEVNLLVSPAHSPVNLPAKLAIEVCGKVEVTAMSATADVVSLSAVLGERCDLCKVRVTLGAEDAYRGVSRLFCVVLFLELLGRFACVPIVEIIVPIRSEANSPCAIAPIASIK